MAGADDVERDLQMLAIELRQLEGEFNLYFAGRLPRPPLQTRARVEALLKRCERAAPETAAQRFRFTTLQARYASFSELWERALRAREEGRPGPLGRRAVEPVHAPPQRTDHHVYVASFTGPAPAADQLRRLYEAVADARRATGEPAVSFEKFAELVKANLARLRHAGSGDVTFRVAVRDGKVNLTAKGLDRREEEAGGESGDDLRSHRRRSD